VRNEKLKRPNLLDKQRGTVGHTGAQSDWNYACCRYQ